LPRVAIKKVPKKFLMKFTFLLSSSFRQAPYPRALFSSWGDGDSVVDELDFRARDSTGNLLGLWINDTVAPTQTAPVPKPATALLAAVAGGLLTFRRKRKDLSIFSPKASPKDGQSARLA
jgi:hypothetical protein